MNNNRPVIVIGHKNPDTDSVCSAISYAYLKSQLSQDLYVPMRAGHINQETRYVLDRFGFEAPEYIKDVRTQVMDIEIRHTEGVTESISLKRAWTIMKELNVVTLPITKDNKLKGLITIGDIAKSYMDVYDSHILSTARTQFTNIIETIDGTLICGNENDIYCEGKVLIAAANPDLMENYIEENDLVILGNRYESQLCAIEMKARCIIVCEGASVSKTIRKLADDNNCIVISTPHDTFTVARLINQSMPISYFMCNKDIISFKADDYLDDIHDVMAQKRHRDFPILNKDGEYVGMISRRNLLGMRGKRVIMVDHNEKSQAVNGIETTELLEIIDHHRLGSVQTVSPVYFRNQPLGCTATIIYMMFCEHSIVIPKDIAGLLCSAILSDTLIFKSPTCTATDKTAATELAKIAQIDMMDLAKGLFKAGSNLNDKTAAEIVNQDFKKYAVNDFNIGIGQINLLSDEEVMEIREKIEAYLPEAIKNNGVSMVYVLLTNIMDEASDVLACGIGAKSALETAFGVTTQVLNGSDGAGMEKEVSEVYIEGLVSRKKQMVPALVGTLQN